MDRGFGPGPQPKGATKMGVIEAGGNVMPGRGVDSYRVTPLAADPDAILAAYTDDGAAASFPTDGALAGQPDVCRNVTATAGGTATDIKAISVTVTGTNIQGEVITEVLPAFTVDTAGIVQGVKAFRSVTQIDIPAHDGTGATTAVGFGDKLGLPYESDRNTVLAAFLAGVKEGTAPTVVVDADEIEKNTCDLNSALNGTEVTIDFYRAG